MKPITIPMKLIDPDPDQPRQSMNHEALQELADNLSRLGQLQPIIVYSVGDRFGIADGHRRFEAMTMRQAESINALALAEKPPPDILLMTQLAANCHRADLKPSELATSFERLRQLKGWTNAEIARHLSISKAKVTQVMSYLKLPDKVRSMVDDGTLAGSTAYAISRAPDKATQQALLHDAMSGNLKRDNASKRVGRKKGSQSQVRSVFRLEDADVTVASNLGLDLDGFVSVCQQLIKECRRATKQGIDVSTLERVLNDQRNARA